jgi:hypothetical protein
MIRILFLHFHAVRLIAHLRKIGGRRHGQSPGLQVPEGGHALVSGRHEDDEPVDVFAVHHHDGISLDGTDEEKKVLAEIIDAANDLCEELDAYDKVKNSFVEWYYERYKAQQAE